MSFIVAGAIGGGVTGLGIGKGAALGFGANLVSKMFGGGKDDAFKGETPLPQLETGLLWVTTPDL